MKILRTVCTFVVACGVLVIFSTAVAKADQTSGSDPRILIGGDPASAPAGIITPSFNLSTATGASPVGFEGEPNTSPCVLTQGGISTTSPDCLFENDITINGVGETISSLTFTFNNASVPTSSVTCDTTTLPGSPFSACGVDALPNGQGTAVSFDTGSIPFQDDFTLAMDGFPSDSQFSVQAGLASTVAPEPGTLALLLSGLGLGGLWVRRQARAS
jgi:hypothetical protein